MTTQKRIASRLCAIPAVCLFLIGAAAPAAAKDDWQSGAPKLLLDSIEKLDVPGVRTALDKGANPNNWVSGNTEKCTSVIAALAIPAMNGEVENAEKKGVEILEILFKAGAKLQPCDPVVLFFPVAHGSALFTEALLNNGASPTKEIEGQTPMEIAVQHGQANIVELLKKHGAPALEPRDAAQQALIGAARAHDIPRMEDAIGDGADVDGSNRRGETALVGACGVMLGDIEQSATVLYLLKKGADPTIQGSDDSPDVKTTALHQVIFWTSSVFDKRNQEKNERLKDEATRDKAVIEALLQHGALVSARDSYGRTPLHIAAKWNNLAGATMLIEAGAKIMPHDDEGKTPLDYAESAEMIKLLKDHGAKEE